ncbi:hypothetical protein LshimejAT787_1602870 [Lyophyllum shimeji]|uniref:MARVEL domain-containing protein n=1 Tax=Lyophyllum shimeji TaxID=47721 RepID=A0A9P3Q001_LYOSH|nr:hypothetical protein LshimejAT787_1602870 [Lyophyllum shimeji]
MAVLSAVRIALYALLAICSVVLMGLTGARIYHTRHSPRGTYYDPTVAELISSSIISFVWAVPLIGCIGARVEGGFFSSYLLEFLGNCALWILYLVGTAVYAKKFHKVNFCWHIASQCRLMTAIHAFAWTNFIILTFLLLATLGSALFGRNGIMAPLHGESAAAGGAAGYGAGRQARPAGGAGGQQGGPETRSVEGGPVTQGQGSAA